MKGENIIIKKERETFHKDKENVGEKRLFIHREHHKEKKLEKAPDPKHYRNRRDRIPLHSLLASLLRTGFVASNNLRLDHFELPIRETETTRASLDARGAAFPTLDAARCVLQSVAIRRCAKTVQQIRLVVCQGSAPLAVEELVEELLR